MIHAYVPTDRIKRDWRVDIKTKELYDLLLASGMMWVWYPDIPSWSEVEKQLKSMEDK